MASISFRSDEEIILEAVQNNGDAIKFADKYLSNDLFIIKEALRNNGKAIRFLT